MFFNGYNTKILLTELTCSRQQFRPFCCKVHRGKVLGSVGFLHGLEVKQQNAATAHPLQDFLGLRRSHVCCARKQRLCTQPSHKAAVGFCHKVTYSLCFQLAPDVILKTSLKPAYVKHKARMFRFRLFRKSVPPVNFVCALGSEL